MISDLEVFIQVVESNSFFRASKVLKLSTATVTRKVAKLEETLGVTLLNRNTRRFSLTSHGENCYKKCRIIPEIISELHNEINNKLNEPTGTLSLSISAYSCYMEFIPIISKFLNKYPYININFSKTNTYPDLIDDSYDFYFRYKEISTRILQSKRLIGHQLICCATAAYLKKNGIPTHPKHLTDHNCIVHQINAYEGDMWTFHQENKALSVSVRGNLRLNNSILVLEAALEGIGIARLPSYYFQKFIDRGELIEVLASYRMPELTVWLVHPRAQYLTSKHSVFIDFILEAYQSIAKDVEVIANGY